MDDVLGEMMDITHDELAIKAGKWLKKTGIKVPDMDNYHGVGLVTVNNRLMYNDEKPDVIGFANMADNSVVIEVKVSRRDFKKDSKKHSRTYYPDGMGNYRYYCCPDGLIKPEELPVLWGLLYWRNGKIVKIVDADRINVVNMSAERYMLIYYLRYLEKFAKNKI